MLNQSKIKRRDFLKTSLHKRLLLGGVHAQPIEG